MKQNLKVVPALSTGFESVNKKTQHVKRTTDALTFKYKYSKGTKLYIIKTF